MESLTLIDVAFESDSLLPTTWNPEDAQAHTFETVLKLTPPLSGDACKTPELQQSPPTDSMGRDEREVRTLKQMISEVDPSEESSPPLAVPETTFADEQLNQEREQLYLAPPPESTGKGAPAGAPANSSLLNASAKKKRRIRSARAVSNLRKSLAWDKAFLTDEGVLDLDELPLATKAPRKLPDLLPLEIPKIWGMPSPLPSSDKVIAAFNAKTSVDADRENINFTPVEKSRQPPGEENDSVNHGALPVTNLPAKTPSKTPARLEAKASKSDKTRLVPVSQTIKAEELKGSKLRLPSTFTGKKEKVEVPPNLTSEDEKDFLRRCKSSSSVLSPSGSSLSKRVSSVSKKVKNTLGKVLPGGFGGSTRSSSKSPEGPSVSNSSNPSHLRQPLDAIGEDPSSPSPPPVSITKSKSSHSILSRGSTEAASNTKKKGAISSVERSAATEATSTAVTGSELVVSNLKGSSKLKNVGLLMSLCSKAAPSTKKVNEKPSSYFKKVSPVFSRKKSGAAAAATTAHGEDHATEKVSTEPGQPRSKTPASALRLPSPKIGFFDSAKPVTTEHQTTSNSGSDNLSRKNQGGSAKPKSGLPPAGRVEPHASHQQRIRPPSGRHMRTGFPPAPHARSTGKRDKGLSATSSAPESPQKRVRDTPIGPGVQDPPSAVTRGAPAEVSADEAQNRSSEYDDIVVITELRPSPAPVQDLNGPALDHRVQHNESSIPGEDPSSSAQTSPQPHGSESRGDDQGAAIHRTVDKNQSKELDESLKISPAKQESPTLGCIQAVGHLKEDDEGGSTLSDVIEELSPGSRGLFGSNVIDSVLCREEAASVIEALTSTSWQSDSDNLAATGEKINAMLRQEISVTPGAERHQPEAHPLRQRDYTPAHESYHSPVDKDTRRQSKSRGSESKTGPLAEVKRRDSGNFEANPATRSAIEKANSPVMSDCNVEEIVIHDLAEVMKGLWDDDQDVQRFVKPEISPSLEISSSINNGCLPKPEDSQKFSTPSGHQAPVDTKSKTDTVESPSHWSDWSILTGPAKANAQTPKAVTKERASSNTLVKSATPKAPPSSKRLSSGSRTVAAESLQNLVDKISTSPSGPAAAFHVTQQTPKSPLAVNVVLLNDVNGRTTAANTRRQLQVAVDHAATVESRLSGQENERSVKTSAHVAGNLQKEPQQLHGAGKPTTKHRKQVSSQRLELSDKDDSPTEASFAFSEERLRALEAAGAESFQTKSGAVQHSPPNKTNANTNPWSPVKKPGKQLGPFDCTKKYGHATAAGHQSRVIPDN